jgi:hypothetical protein
MLQKQKKPNWYPAFEMLTDLSQTLLEKREILNTNPAFKKAWSDKHAKFEQLKNQLPSEDLIAMEYEYAEWAKSKNLLKVLDKKFV